MRELTTQWDDRITRTIEVIFIIDEVVVYDRIVLYLLLLGLMLRLTEDGTSRTK